MQGYLVAVCWVAVVAFAAIVLGFLTYEVSWKSRRLAADRKKLTVLIDGLLALGRADGRG